MCLWGWISRYWDWESIVKYGVVGGGELYDYCYKGIVFFLGFVEL